MSIWKPLLVPIVALSMVGPAAAAEDTTSTPAPGTRVRATTMRGGQIVGKLISRDENTLRIETSPGKEATLSVADVARLEESRRPSHHGRGAIIGFAVGAAVGAIAGASANSGCDPSTSGCYLGGATSSDGQAAVAAALVFGGLGALVGTLVAHGEKWVPVASHHARLTVMPIRGRGLSARLTIAI